MRKAKEAGLAKLDLFAACRKDELRRIARLVDEVDVRAGQTVTRKGRPAREVVIAASDVVVVENGAVRTIRAGTIVDMSPFTGGSAAATVVTLEAGRVFVLDARAIPRLLQAAPLVALRLLRSEKLQRPSIALVS